MILSSKQLGVLLVVANKNDDGSPVDLHQIIERQTYDTNKPSIQFIIRNLIEKGLINKSGTEVRDKRRKVLFDTTPLGDKFAEWNRPKSIKETIVE